MGFAKDADVKPPRGRTLSEAFRSRCIFSSPGRKTNILRIKISINQRREMLDFGYIASGFRLNRQERGRGKDC